MNKSLFGELYIRAAIIYGMLIIFIPICFKKKIGGLANIALVGSVALIYIIIVSKCMN